MAPQDGLLNRVLLALLGLHHADLNAFKQLT